MSSNLVDAFMEGIPSDFIDNPPPIERKISFREALDELQTFCDPEPKSLLSEPGYKPMAAPVDGFHKVINIRRCPYRQAIVFTVYRPANPKTRSPKSEIHLAIPDFELAEEGYGIPGEWKWRNEVLNSGVGAADDLPDPFEDLFNGEGDPFAD